jgi:hypothetical protein
MSYGASVSPWDYPPKKACAIQICPHCGQPYHHHRLGVDLTPLKARIVDIVRAAGDIGVSKREIHYELYQGYQHARNTDTVRTHLRQINDLLESTDWVLVSEGRSHNARWVLRQKLRTL